MLKAAKPKAQTSGKHQANIEKSPQFRAFFDVYGKHQLVGAAPPLPFELPR
jgi:hypothetical protein